VRRHEQIRFPNEDGQFTRNGQHAWYCCGKGRRGAAFCSDCGRKRPAPDDARDLLAYFQKQRQTAEKIARTHTDVAQTMEQEAAVAAEPSEPCCGDYPEGSKPYLESKACWRRSMAEVAKRRAALFGEWAAILAELMAKAGIQE